MQLQVPAALFTLLAAVLTAPVPLLDEVLTPRTIENGANIAPLNTLQTRGNAESLAERDAEAAKVSFPYHGVTHSTRNPEAAKIFFPYHGVTKST